MTRTPGYPTREHERAAEAIVQFFAGRDETHTVLLVNSCARGKATRDSCLDVTILVPAGVNTSESDTAWRRFHETAPVFEALRRAGKYSVVHLDIEDDRFDLIPELEDEDADGFELRIGNLIAYGIPLWERGDAFARLQEQWLPYYGEHLRQERLARARYGCQHHLEHIPLYVERGLYFQSLGRLWAAFHWFLQALFISRRTYPLAYDKWIHEQVVQILGLPDLYEHLPHLFEIERFESNELVGKADDLQRLLETYVAEEPGTSA